MKITILGCGASQGVPLINCDCNVCTSSNTKNKRLRSSILITTENTQFMIDASPDFRQQGLTHKIETLDAVLFTHIHADHIGGLEDLRPYTYTGDNILPIYLRENDFTELANRYHYIFNPDPTYKGGALPKFDPQIVSAYKSFNINEVKITPFEVLHGNMVAVGYKVNNLVYIPDCHEIPKESLDLIQNPDCLIIDGLWKRPPHPSHFNVDQAIELSESINAQKTFITHMTHDIDYEEDSKNLPPNVEYCYDGLEIIY